MQIGQQFGVAEYQEFRDGKQLVAKYHPGQPYRVTERNLKFVNLLADQKKAGGWQGKPTAIGEVSGTVEITAVASGSAQAESAEGGN